MTRQVAWGHNVRPNCIPTGGGPRSVEERQYYSCIESREVKEDKYRAERSDRFEVVSIEQTKDE